MRGDGTIILKVLPSTGTYESSCLDLGSVMLKTVPLPTELDTLMFPLCSFTIQSAMDNPSPVPPYLPRAGLINPVKPLNILEMFFRYSLACVGKCDFNQTESGV